MLAKQQKKKNQSSSAQFIIICVVYLNACFYRERLLQVGDHTPQNCLILWGSLAHKTSQGSEVRINLLLEAAWPCPNAANYLIPATYIIYGFIMLSIFLTVTNHLTQKQKIVTNQKVGSINMFKLLILYLKTEAEPNYYFFFGV